MNRLMPSTPTVQRTPSGSIQRVARHELVARVGAVELVSRYTAMPNVATLDA